MDGHGVALNCHEANDSYRGMMAVGVLYVPHPEVGFFIAQNSHGKATLGRRPFFPQ
jgi:hypothetical protein